QHDSDLARWSDSPKLVSLIRARPKISFAIKAESVCTTGRLHKSGQLAIGAPFENPVVRLIGEKDVALGIASRAFGKFEIVCENLQDCAPRDDFAVGSTHGCAGDSQQ